MALHPLIPYLLVLTVILLFLSFNVIRLRYKYNVSINDDNQRQLSLAIRAHANFCEYTPFIVILLICLAFMQPHHWVLHAFAALLVIGRLVHAYSLVFIESRIEPTFRYRQFGMTLTFIALIATALGLFFKLFV